MQLHGVRQKRNRMLYDTFDFKVSEGNKRLYATFGQAANMGSLRTNMPMVGQISPDETYWLTGMQFRSNDNNSRTILEFLMGDQPQIEMPLWALTDAVTLPVPLIVPIRQNISVAFRSDHNVDIYGSLLLFGYLQRDEC